ncbi:hypothetical protein KJ877_08840 [bacterium]|nr:hypothetical protein [bacterium]MBU1990803.1 hypothetical protein [bacterium]
MKILFLFVSLCMMLHADFFIVNGDKKVKMGTFESGKIDFALFDTLPHISRGNDELHAMGKEIAFNHRHLNFRLATITIPQSNYTITEFSEKAKDESEAYYINFDNYTRDDGVMLQLFYKNNWYGIILGEPLEILHTLFSRKDLDLDKALYAIKRARIAFPEDDTLKQKQLLLEEKKSKEPKQPAEYSKQVKIIFK